MPGKRFEAEEIADKRRQAAIEISPGSTAAAVCKLLGITDAMHLSWPQEYGGMRVDQGERLKTLERENARAKRLLADAMRLSAPHRCQLRRSATDLDFQP